jgi:hypothetical protein
MGRALFGSLIVCALVAICTIGAYQHIYYNKPEIMKDVRKLSHNKMEQYYSADTTIPASARPARIEESMAKYEENLSLGNFARIQFMMCLSMGMIVALVSFLFNLNKQRR